VDPDLGLQMPSVVGLGSALILVSWIWIRIQEGKNDPQKLKKVNWTSKPWKRIRTKTNAAPQQWFALSGLLKRKKQK
jgi:hypothetical protein